MSHAAARHLTALLLIACLSCSHPTIETPSERIEVSGAEHADEHVDDAESPADLDEPSRTIVSAHLAPRSWLYRVHGGDSLAPSFVLGTMHVGVAFPRAVPTPLDSAMLDCRSVVMELDLREAARFLREAPGVRRARRTWIDRTLPRATWDRLVDELAAVARPEEIAPLPPGLMAIYLRQVRMAEVEAEDDGWVNVPGLASPTHLDRWIFDWAMVAGVPLVALETPEEALLALSSFQQGNALDALRSIVDEPEVARSAARRLRDAYLSLEEDQVLAILAEMSDEERHATFTVRNEAWMRRLLPELRAGGAFVAVGLAHLLGPESVLELLAQAGYQVERVLGDGGMSPPEHPGEWIWTRAPERPPY